MIVPTKGMSRSSSAVPAGVSTAARRYVNERRPLLIAAGLPDAPTGPWARRVLRAVTPECVASGGALGGIVADAYVDVVGPAWIASNRARFAAALRLDSYADDTVTSLMIVAGLTTLRKLTIHALRGEPMSPGYARTTLTKAFIDAGRAHRQAEGGASREDWFSRSARRRATFDGSLDMLWLADRITRQLYAFPYRADVERADPFPLAAWADELEVGSVATVRRMVDDVLERIATDLPDVFGANLARPLQVVHERLAGLDEGEDGSDVDGFVRVRR